jgi:DNA-binding NarL/FixJ family response regulator
VPRPIRVLLADDHALVRAGIRSLLRGCDDIEVVAEAGDGREALTLIEALRPDVVLMDILMPGLNGLEAAEQVSREFPSVRVLILSVNTGEEFVLQALRAGVAGYLVKSIGPAELQAALRAVARGEVYLAAAISHHVLAGSLEGGEGCPSLQRLTPRQREVLQLIAEGHKTKEIALRLEISINTVETHRTQLMAALDIHDIAGLVRYAIRSGLTSADT